MTVLRMLDHTGHKEVHYDPAVVDDRLKEAKDTFDSARKMGYMAYVVVDKTEGQHIRSFKEVKDAKEVILQPALRGG